METNPMASHLTKKPLPANANGPPPDKPEPPPIPLPGEPRLALHASGRWETGGTVSLFLDNRYVDDVDLPAGEWAVLALLIEAAHHARTSSATKAYRHTTELARGV